METDPYMTVPDAPPVPGLAFRHFTGKEDYKAMVNVLNGSKHEDRLEFSISVEDIANGFNHLYNFDPYTDMLFVEMDGDVIGYTEVWREDLEDVCVYPHAAYLLPEWRGKGIRRAMVHYNEQRGREIRLTHLIEKPHFFQAWTQETETHWVSLLESENYAPVRFSVRMARSLSEPIPDAPLPEGIEVCPARPDQYWAIWRATCQSLRELWQGSRFRDEMFEEWMGDSTFNPALWVVAWDAENKVAGAILNFIDEAENKEYHHRRGHVEFVTVAQPYRGKGLAKALIARSLSRLKEEGMIEAVLGVDADNPSGALRLYERMGFSPVRRRATYQKSMDE
ncbi:MAG: GNAT family N-acetyltransferase [Theionarchaea archaeon]|nr:GNAT family N-acetyltransferase [Theionarchaea archaeon]MBU7037868.1 GNAT family N-acetyltransferase [Theionarchaea archaeon]